jgi:hypothetical protein
MQLLIAHESGELKLQQLASSYTLTSTHLAVQQLVQGKLAATVVGNNPWPNRAKLLQYIDQNLPQAAQNIQAAGANNAIKAAWAARLQQLLPSNDAPSADARAALFQVFAELAAACAVEKEVPDSLLKLLKALWGVSAGTNDLTAQAAAGNSSKSTYTYGTSQVYVSAAASSGEVAAVMLGAAANSPDTLR